MFYCKSENLHILLQSFRGFVKRIVLLLHAIKYSLTVIKVWIMQILLPLSTGKYFGRFFITSICQHFFHLLSWFDDLTCKLPSSVTLCFLIDDFSTDKDWLRETLKSCTWSFETPFFDSSPSLQYFYKFQCYMSRFHVFRYRNWLIV